VGGHVAVGEQDAVLVVAAHAGGIEGGGERDDVGGERAFGDDVAGEDDVVFGGGMGEVFEEVGN
jgi:hypothetical protein